MCAINSAALLLRSANDSIHADLRTVRTLWAATTWTHQFGHDGHFKVSKPTIFSKDAGVNDFYFVRQTSNTHGAHFVRRQAGRNHPKGWCTGHRPELHSGADAKHSLDFWLTSEDFRSQQSGDIGRDGKM